jgi:hypothetical protein
MFTKSKEPNSSFKLFENINTNTNNTKNENIINNPDNFNTKQADEQIIKKNTDSKPKQLQNNPKHNDVKTNKDPFAMDTGFASNAGSEEESDLEDDEVKNDIEGDKSKIPNNGENNNKQNKLFGNSLFASNTNNNAAANKIFNNITNENPFKNETNKEAKNDEVNCLLGIKNTNSAFNFNQSKTENNNANSNNTNTNNINTASNPFTSHIKDNINDNVFSSNANPGR